MDLVRVLHIAGGAVVLLALVTVLARRKGDVGHRRAGWIFAWGMFAVVGSGAFISGIRLVDARPENDAGSAFLLFVGLLTAEGLASGLRAVRSRPRTRPSRHPLELGPPALLVLASAMLALGGVWRGDPLFVVFAVLGGIRGVSDLRFWSRPPTDARAWLRAHVSGMGTAAIAAVTALGVVNAGRFLPGVPPIVIWVTPGVIGGAILTVVERRLRPSSRGSENRSETSFSR